MTTLESVDFVFKMLSSIAIVAGGGWALYQFRITEAAKRNVQANVSGETFAHLPGYRLLVIHLKLRNVGRVAAEPGPGGIKVTVSRIALNSQEGLLDLAKLPLVYETNIVDRYPDGYLIRSGVETDELVAVVVQEGSMFAVKVLFDVDEEIEVDHTAIISVGVTAAAPT